MKFFYKKLPVVGRQIIFLPLVELLLGTEKFPTICLIDSGATFSFFHGALGRQLGLGIETGEKITAAGATGASFVAYLQREVPVEIGGCQTNIDIAFSDQLGTPYNLLGQHNFFGKFRVCFDLRKEDFELTPKFNGFKI